MALVRKISTLALIMPRLAASTDTPNAAWGDESQQAPLTTDEIQAMPKIELHNHGDGALSPQALCDLIYDSGMQDTYLNINNIKVHRPFYVYENPVDLFYDITDPLIIINQGQAGCAAYLAPWVQSKATTSLSHFLEPFDAITWMLMIPGGPAKMSRAFADRQIATNVIYSEMRYNPGLLVPQANCPTADWVVGPWGTQTCSNIEQQKLIVDETMAEFAVIEAENPGFRFKVNLACVRHLALSDCETMLQVAQGYMPGGAWENPMYFGGVGLAGAECCFPNTVFNQLFIDYAQGLSVAVHTGEVGDKDNCVDAITVMNASRIGHGYLCILQQATVDLILENNIHMEACPSSSRATSAVSIDTVPWMQHPMLDFLWYGFSMGLSTDDPGLTEYTVNMEIEICINQMGFTPEQIKKTQIDAAKAAFTTQAERDQIVATINEWWAPRESATQVDAEAAGGSIMIFPAAMVYAISAFVGLRM